MSEVSDEGKNRTAELENRDSAAICFRHVPQDGGRSPALRDLTCDAHRENAEFRKINPCRPETLASIFYTLDGKIDAADPDVRFDLQETLNLNAPTSSLVGERRCALEPVLKELGEAPAEVRRALCRKYLGGFEAETDPKTPYAGIIIWYLRSLLGMGRGPAGAAAPPADGPRRHRG